MLGRDFSTFGAPHEIIGQLGDSNLWQGRVRVRWVNRSTIIVLDPRKVAYVVSIRGNVEVKLLNAGNDSKEDIKIRSDNEACPEEEYAYWFDDPRSFLISRKEREEYFAELRRQAAVAKAEYVEPTRTIRLNLMAADFARLNLPDSLQIVAADTISQQLKMLERDSWTVDQSIGGIGNGVGLHYGISGVDVIKIDDETSILCTCDADLNRIQLLDLDGRTLVSFGEEGPKAGQFRRPCAITSFVKHPDGRERRADCDMFTPKWFLGECHKETLEDGLLGNDNDDSNTTDVSIGDFRVGRRPDCDNQVYDLVYLSKSHRTVWVVLRRVGADEGGTAVFVQTTQGRGAQTYASLWHYIMSQKHLLKPVREVRPYALIAVAEADNPRVQVFRYYWAKSEIFLPSFDYLLMIGGVKELLYKLTNPVDVSFSPTGELAITDTDRIFILTPNLGTAQVITLPYSPFLLTKEQRTHQQQVIEAKSNQETQSSGIHKDESKSSSRDTPKAQWPVWAHRVPSNAAESKQTLRDSREAKTYTTIYANITNSSDALRDGDKKFSSAAFAPDGKLAVGYQSGGVIVFSAYKSLPCGIFHVFSLTGFDTILSFCSYEDLQAIRNCSRLFHDHTRSLRDAWRLGKMRTRQLPVVHFSFLRWSTTRAGELALSRSCFKDEVGKDLCLHLLGSGNCPLGNSCPYSHQPLQSLGYPEHYPPASDLGLEYLQFLQTTYAVFGPKFVWQKELYLEALFDEYAGVVTRPQRQSVKGDMLRKVTLEKTKVLGVKRYLSIMISLEEDFVSSKHIELHPLFRRYPRGSMQPRGPYDFESIEKRIYVDPQEQYDRGLGVSCLPSKGKSVTALKGMSNKTRGEDLDTPHLHIASFQHLGDKADGMVRGLFKTVKK